MVFRLCALLLALFLASCSGSSDSADNSPAPAASSPTPAASSLASEASSASTFAEEGTSTSSFAPPTVADKPAAPIPVSSAEYSVRRQDVSETPGSKPQTINLNGNVINFTATAGQLIAYPNQWEAGAEAAISYRAYTRDGPSHDTRPVTFVFNGGPGGSAAGLDINFLGPKSVDKDGFAKDNVNTLLDKTDLVFVDPVGTGYSQAISPYKNKDFWGADNDASVLRDFILRYINVNNRQSSPKYIYGVSYGGFRAPIIGRLLIEDRTTGYVADASNKPAKVLTGLILNSPILSLWTNCRIFARSCGGNVPTYALVADYQKAKKSNQDVPPVAEEKVAELRAFAGTFDDLFDKVFHGLAQGLTEALVPAIPDRSAWDQYILGLDGAGFVSKLVQLTGIGAGNDNPWIENPNMNSLQFAGKFDPSKGHLSLNDGREFLLPQKIDPMLDRTSIEAKYMKDYLAAYMGYTAPPTPFMDLNGEIIGNWNYEPNESISMGKDDQRTYNTIADLAFSLKAKEKPKVLIQHGYYDLNTPFHQSELDLKVAGLADKVAVSTYEGGHGIDPLHTSSYGRVMQALRAFYDQPQAQLIAALNAAGSEGKSR